MTHAIAPLWGSSRPSVETLGGFSGSGFPAGKTRTITVDPSVQRFKEVKKGDELVVRHTEALAIALGKP